MFINNKIGGYCFALAAIFVRSGCAISEANKELSTEVQTFASSRIYSENGEKNLIIIKPEGSTDYICVAPNPDSVMTASASSQLSLTTKFSGEDADLDKLNLGSVSLGGRSPGVLITRELMYRACEFISNMNLNRQEALNIYQRNLEVLETLLMAEMSRAKVESAEAPVADTSNTE